MSWDEEEAIQVMDYDDEVDAYHYKVIEMFKGEIVRHGQG